MPQLSSIITRTILCFFALFFVFETANAQTSLKTNSKISFGKATYRGINAGKVMRAWLIGGPIKISADSLEPDATSQQKYFDREENQFISATSGNTLPQISYKNKPIRWTRYQSKKDIIDFDSIYKKADFSSAYALAEIIADTPTTALFAIGSDDALKVWHNGKLVHKNWVARAIRPDDDIIKLNLIKGKNHLLL